MDFFLGVQLHFTINLKNFLDKCEKRGDFGAYIVKDKIPSPDNSDLEN